MTSEIEIVSHKEFHTIIEKSQDYKLSKLIKEIVIDELALLSEDLIKNGSNLTSVYKSFIKLSGTINDRI